LAKEAPTKKAPDESAKAVPKPSLLPLALAKALVVQEVGVVSAWSLV
jgi:hypothetical protein